MASFLLFLVVRLFAVGVVDVNPAHVPGGPMQSLTAAEDCTRGQIIPCS